MTTCAEKGTRLAIAGRLSPVQSIALACCLLLVGCTKQPARETRKEQTPTSQTIQTADLRNATVRGQVYAMLNDGIQYGAGLPVILSTIDRVSRDSLVQFCTSLEHLYGYLNNQETHLSSRDRRSLADSLYSMEVRETILIREVVGRAAVATTEAGPDGGYQFSSVVPGTYTIFAESEHWVWWKDVTVNPGENSQHLGMQSVRNRRPFAQYRGVCNMLAQ